MKLGMEIGLRSGRIVLDGDPPKAAQQPLSFRHMSCGLTVAHLSYGSGRSFQENWTSAEIAGLDTERRLLT